MIDKAIKRYRDEQGQTKADSRRYPGLSFSLILRLREHSMNRRQFVFDIGENTERNRVSLYLDPGGNLCFSVIDRDSETHTLKVPPSFDTFSVGSFLYVRCEYGNADDFSFLRMAINGREVDRKERRVPIEISPSVQLFGGKLGADLRGENGGVFDVSRILIYTATPDFNEQIALFRELKREAFPSAFVRFNGKQFLGFPRTAPQPPASGGTDGSSSPAISVTGNISPTNVNVDSLPPASGPILEPTLEISKTGSDELYVEFRVRNVGKLPAENIRSAVELGGLNAIVAPSVLNPGSEMKLDIGPDDVSVLTKTNDMVFSVLTKTNQYFRIGLYLEYTGPTDRYLFQYRFQISGKRIGPGSFPYLRCERRQDSLRNIMEKFLKDGPACKIGTMALVFSMPSNSNQIEPAVLFSNDLRSAVFDPSNLTFTFRSLTASGKQIVRSHTFGTNRPSGHVCFLLTWTEENASLWMNGREVR